MCNDLLDRGYTLQKFFTTGKEAAYNEVIKSNKEEFDIIIACGGDGTVNEVINALADVKSKMKLGIVPMGTVNDFATYLGLSSSGDTLVELIDNDLSTYSSDTSQTGLSSLADAEKIAVEYSPEIPLD